jgi:predicted PurR-regulated permease PerM
MQPENQEARKQLSKDLLNSMIQFGLIIIAVYLSIHIFAPFAGLMLWALILAVALYPLQKRLASRLKGKQGRTATLLVLAGLLVIGLPTVMLGSSFANHLHGFHGALENSSFTIKQPADSVAKWPLIGEKVHSAWSSAASDFPAFLEKFKPQLKNFSKKMLSTALNTAGSVFMFLASLIIAGIMMAYGEAGSSVMQRILIRLAGQERGVRLHALSTATIRSVAMGVVGVAFIQALLLGVGFVMAGIPGAGVLALVVLLIGILQLPALIISLPVIAYLWWAGDASTVANIFFTIYLLLAGAADNVLKPLLLGRGVDVPMPIILLGALGGMVSAGIIGLFLGAVILAVGYQVFMEWVNEQGPEITDTPEIAGDAVEVRD